MEQILCFCKWKEQCKYDEGKAYFLKQSSPKDMFLLLWEKGRERKTSCEREILFSCLQYMPYLGSEPKT